METDARKEQAMKKLAMIAAGGLISMVPSFASARTFWGFGFRFGWPVPAPAVVCPAPVFVAPAPVAVVPPPCVVAPPVPVVLAPAPVITYCPPAPHYYYHYGYFGHARPFYATRWHYGR
jgi:hypothetical protein